MFLQGHLKNRQKKKIKKKAYGNTGKKAEAQSVDMSSPLKRIRKLFRTIYYLNLHNTGNFEE